MWYLHKLTETGRETLWFDLFLDFYFIFLKILDENKFGGFMNVFCLYCWLLVCVVGEVQ